jgi:hypothetical protein
MFAGVVRVTSRVSGSLKPIAVYRVRPSPPLHTAGDHDVAQEILINVRRTMRTRMRIDQTP